MSTNAVPSLGSIRRYTVTVRRDARSSVYEFAAEHLTDAGPSIDKDRVRRHHECIEGEGGDLFYWTTWGMTAELRVDVGGFARRDGEVRVGVSQSAIGAMNSRTARARVACMLLACRYADLMEQLSEAELRANGVFLSDAEKEAPSEDRLYEVVDVTEEVRALMVGAPVDGGEG